MYHYKTRTVEPSYKSLCKKMTLGSLSSQYAESLAEAAIVNPDSNGICAEYHKRINTHTMYILRYSSLVWNNITMLKELVDIRGGIKEKRMKDIDESQELLDSTKKLQVLVQAISKQESNFISMYDCINKHVFQLYNEYIDTTPALEESIKHITEDAVSNLNESLPKDLYPLDDILHATNISQLRTLYNTNHIQEFFTDNLFDWAVAKIDINDPHDFSSLQAWLIILSRHVKKQSSELSSQKDILDAKKAFETLLSKRTMCAHIPSEQTDTEELELLEALDNTTSLNMDYYNEIKDSLLSLKLLSDNRKDPPEEDEQNSGANEDEDYE